MSEKKVIYSGQDREAAIDAYVKVSKKRHKLDANGHEVLDPMPMAPPVGYRRQPTLAERIRDMVRSERLRQEAMAAGAETFEEADDFEIGDDYDPRSPYEQDFDPTPVSELRRRAAQAAAELAAVEAAAAQQTPVRGEGAEAPSEADLLQERPLARPMKTKP